MLLLFSSFGLLANSSWTTRSWRGSWRSVQRTQESWNPNGSKQKEVLGLIYPNSFGSQRSKQTFPMSCSMFMGHNALNLLSSVAEKARPLIRFIWSVECFFSLLIWMRDGHFKTMKFHIIIQKKNQWSANTWLTHIPDQQLWLELGGYDPLFAQPPSLPVISHPAGFPHLHHGHGSCRLLNW